MANFDVCIIGAGVTGAAVARELSRYNLSVCVLERYEDVCSGTSKANSGIVHAGYDAAPGSLKAKMNVRGAELIRQLSKALDFHYKQNGSLVICFNEQDKETLEKLYQRGIQNGVKNLSTISGEQARKLEPALSEDVVAALHAPDAGIVCPFGLTIALAENAADNGVEFKFLTEVTSVSPSDNGYIIKTNNGDISAKYVVNAAGVYADEIHNMVSNRKLHITARRGEYVLMDKEVGGLVSNTIFQVPGKLGKGVLVTPTVHGNLMVGPNAVDIDLKDDTETTAEGIADIKQRALASVPNILYNKTITNFSGIRAHEDGGDFILGEPEDAPGFFDAAGIESPGLTSAPAIGEYIAALIAEKSGAEKKNNFIEKRTGIPVVAELDPQSRSKLIAEKPEFGTIICRCENISEGEILSAIHRTLGARSMDGIKRRVRQGMGRCQAGFCTAATLNILARELGIPPEKITKNIPGSELLKEGK